MYVEHIFISIHNLHLADKFSIVSTAPEERKVKVVPLPPFSQFHSLGEGFNDGSAGNFLF